MTADDLGELRRRAKSARESATNQKRIAREAKREADRAETFAVQSWEFYERLNRLADAASERAKSAAMELQTERKDQPHDQDPT